MSYRTYSFTAGAILRGALRRHLDNAVFDYPGLIIYRENKTWLDSEFRVRVHSEIQEDFEYWVDQLVYQYKY